MSDLDLAYEPGPDPQDFIRAERRRAMGEAMTSLTDDPQKVGRAYELGRATGDKPALIYGDLDNYEEQHKAALTSQLLNSNAHLREYIDADPMHAKLSNDDWGNLDTVSASIAKFRKSAQASPFGMVTRPGGVMDSAMQGFLNTLRETQVEGGRIRDQDLKYPFATAVMQTAVAPFDIIGGVFKGLTEGLRVGAEEVTGDKTLARDLAAAAEMQLMGQGVHSIPKPTAKGVAEGNLNFWDRNPEYRAAAEKAYKAAEDTKLWLDSSREPPAGLNRDIDKLKLDQNNADLKHLDEAVRDAQSSATRERDPETFARFIRMRDEGTIAIDGEAVAKLYGDKVPHGEDGLLGWGEGIEAQLATARAVGGEIEVPLADFLARVDPEVYKALKDDIRVRPGGITKNEAKVASEQREVLEVKFSIEEPVGKTAYELDREEFRKKNNLPEATTEEVAETIRFRISQLERDQRARRVEGEKPEPNGELFGLRQRLRELQPRHGARAHKVIPEDLPQLRAHAGLEPLFSIGDRKLKIERGKQIEGARFGPSEGFHDFKILDENEQQVGSLNLSEQNGGKQLYVDMIQAGPNFYNPNSMGPALMRDLLRQIKEAFPNAETITGHRVSGAREKAGSYMAPSASPVVKLEAGDIADFAKILNDPYWERVTEGVEALYKPTETWTTKEKELSAAIEAELYRIAPGLKVDVVHSIYAENAKRAIGGLFHNDPETGLPAVLISLESKNPIGVSRHEGIHHLKSMGFFTEGEWNTLTRAVRDGEWINKYKIDERYPDLETSAKLEEAIAEGYRDWKSGNLEIKNPSMFQKLKDFFETLRLKFKEILGRDFTWDELFEKIDEGAVGRRDPNSGRVYGEPKLSVEGEPEAKPLFRTPATIGMTAKQANLYARAIRDMHESDIAWAKDRVEAEQRKQQTAEWKAERVKVRSEVDAEMNARPDVAADLFFARGELYGEKIGAKPKIAWDDVSLEERAALPKDYVAKKGEDGVPLDDIASLVGYPSGRAMVEHLIAYNQAKLTANMSAKAFRDRMVDLETDRQMAGRHGDLEQNILEAAKEQVTSETQLNLIAEEVLALGIRNKGEASINKAALKEWIADQFGESPMKGQSSDKFLKAAGKGGTAAEIGLLKDDIPEAYRAKQQQYLAMMLAKEAVALEKEQKQFATTTKRLGKRDVKGLDQDYQDVIQTLLWQAGLTPKRSLLEIQRSQTQSTSFTDLGSFLDSARGDGWAPEVSEAIIAGRLKSLDQMTVNEFREFKDAIDSLNWIGRQVEKINVRGAKEDFATYRDEVVGNITTLPQRSRDSQERGLAHRMYSVDATLTRMENLMKDLDLGQDMGPLVDATIRPMAEAKHKEYSLQEGLSKQIKELHAGQPKDWGKKLNDIIPNDWFMDPSTGSPFKLSRMDMINIMLNWGNKGNIDKFTRAYGSSEPGRNGTREQAAAFKAKMDAYFDTHATREDWKFVQGVWDIYKSYRADMEQVWRNTAGTQPKLIEPVQIDTAHGTFEGGYYPLIRDQYMSPRPPKGNGEELFGPDYPNFSTPQGHLKERTAAAYYIDFQQPLGRIPMRMQQVIHDIAYRDAVMATAKVIRDKQVKGAIINHYGKEYADQLEPWLQKTARGSTIDEANQKGIDSLLRQARLNLVGYALPWNYVVTLTPDVGSINPAAMSRYYSDKAGNDAIANRLSKEIPHAMYNMDRDFKEAMQRAVNEGKLDEYKTKVARWGYGPVSWASKQFRTVTFIEKFNEALAEGKGEVDAAAIADTYVRERHGAVALHDLPSVMTTGEKGRLLTMFYGYFNTQYNWTRTIPGHIRRGDYQEAMKVAWGSIIVGAFFGATVANQAREEDSWVKRGLKAVPLQLLGMVPFAREFATLAIEGIPPRTPVGSVLQSVVGAGGDIKRYIEKKPIDSGIKHVAALAGLLGGIPGTLQAGRTGQFLWDVNRGKQRPRDLMEWARGIMTGEARLKHKGER